MNECDPGSDPTNPVYPVNLVDPMAFFIKTSLQKSVETALPPVALLIIGFITFYTVDIRISSDMGWHMNTALDLLAGKGFAPSDIAPVFNKGPLWPFIISSSYLVNGVSPWSAFWAVRIFAILNPVLIYFLGKKLFDKWIGFFAALLILSSYSMNFWSYRHLDAVWPFLAIASILTGFSALEKRRIWIFFPVRVFNGRLLSRETGRHPFIPVELPLVFDGGGFQKQAEFVRNSDVSLRVDPPHLSLDISCIL